VDGEVDGKRDGGIQLEDKTIILEVTGRRRGVKPGKIDKLAKHVAHANQKGYCDNCTGLLVYNARRKTDPNSRSLNADNFIGDLEDTGYKFMTSLQVYLMVSMHSKGEIEKSDVVEKLTGDHNIVEFGEFSGMNSEEDFNSRISSIRKRLGRLL
jgi:serine/threonine protein phosphatase PrpC